MRVLAIDTALGACSVAVLDTNAGGLVASESVAMQRGHAESLMPMIARVMHQADLKYFNLDRVAVTTGPGSFTGLRVGIAAARGLALAAAKPAVGVSTLAAYAAPQLAQDDAAPVIAAIDARHGQVYVQAFGHGGCTLFSARLAPIAEAVRAVPRQAPRIVGSAAGLLGAAWPASDPPPLAVEARAAPDIAWVARLGAMAAENEAPPKPLYLRAPDAQPQDAARLPRR